MFVLSVYIYIYYFILFCIHRAILTQTNEKKPLIEKKTRHIWAFLNANTNTNTFEKNKKIQIRVKILPKNVFENAKTNYFQILLIYMNFFIYFIVN